jgi:hypothetical protein
VDRGDEVTRRDEATSKAAGDGRVPRLLDAVNQLADQNASSSPISASRLVNDLLDLWALASELGPTATGPIEEMLTVYSGPRDLAMPSELADLAERLTLALDEAGV